MSQLGMFGFGTFGPTILPPGVEPLKKQGPDPHPAKVAVPVPVVTPPAAVPLVLAIPDEPAETQTITGGGDRVATAPGQAPSRFVICPARITGSMDAEEVEPELATWKSAALRMAARERVPVQLFAIDTDGRWMLRATLGLDGQVRV